MMTINLLNVASLRPELGKRRRALKEAFRRVRVDREITRCMDESRRILGRAPGALPRPSDNFAGTLVMPAPDIYGPAWVDLCAQMLRPIRREWETYG